MNIKEIRYLILLLKDNQKQKKIFLFIWAI